LGLNDFRPGLLEKSEEKRPGNKRKSSFRMEGEFEVERDEEGKKTKLLAQGKTFLL